MKKGVIYARYSSSVQTEQSIEGQVREIQKYAKKNNIDIVDSYIDRATTGTNDNRADFQRMLKDSSKKTWDCVLVYKLDRFSRNKYEMAIHRKALQKNGVKLISVTENIPDSPEGIILESVLEAMAEYYSLDISQKTKRGRRETRLKGFLDGGPLLYGYKTVKQNGKSKIVICEEEAAIVRRIFDEYLTCKPAKSIAKDLDNDGLKKRGNRFRDTDLHYMLYNTHYIGIYIDRNGEVYTNMYPPIISREKFYRVQLILKEKYAGPCSLTDNYILRKRLICGCCGSKMTSFGSTSSSKTRYHYYACEKKIRGKPKCSKSSVSKKLLEGLVVDTLMQVLNTPDNLEILVDKIFEINNRKSQEMDTVQILQKEKENCQAAVKNIMYAIEQGITTNLTKQKLADYDDQLAELDAKIQAASLEEKIVFTKEDIRNNILNAMNNELGQIVRLFIRRMVLYEDKIEIFFFGTNKVGPDEDSRQAHAFYVKKYDKNPLLNANVKEENNNGFEVILLV